jgi:beta-lactamase regulating signal transducer with metallopeptidase domain
MTHVAWVNVYLCANVLVALILGMLTLVGAVSARLRRPISYRHRLLVGHTLVVGAALLPFAALLSGHDDVLPRTAQIWSAPTMNVEAAADQRLVVSFAPVDASMSWAAVRDAAGGVIAMGLFVALVRLGRDIRVTIRIVSEAQTIRRCRRLSIRASDRISVPFSFWLPARYFIVVPSSLVLHPHDLKMAIRHESQHHRQQDTKWLYLYQVLRAIFFFNPAIHSLEKHLRSLQEFACDEALSARSSIVGAEYCRSLLRMAEAAALPHRASVRASMIGGGGPLLLKHRSRSRAAAAAAHQRRPAVIATAAIALTLSAVTALAFGSTIEDRRISAEQAAGMARIARESSAIPIAVNDRVLLQLNLLLATPDGRAYLQASLDRMQSYRNPLSDEIARRGLPAALLAVPLVESGYRNLEPDPGQLRGAGLWMFIEPTARRFGLTIDAKRDERLDVLAETRAAAEYFGELHRHFGDWNLALLAYNAGAAKVEDGIRTTGSRDAWQLIAAGYENYPAYLPRVMAAVLIMENRSVLD